jgi:putative flippase GtrA
MVAHSVARHDRKMPMIRAIATRIPTAARLIRYCSVSVISTAVSLLTLGGLVGVVGMNASWSNVVATAVGTVPSFELNRRWVWSMRGPRTFGRQVLPFCALSFAGLALSTLAVRVVAGQTMHWTHLAHTVAVEAANLAAYGALWVIQFKVLDHFLFRQASESVADRGSSADRGVQGLSEALVASKVSALSAGPGT